MKLIIPNKKYYESYIQDIKEYDDYDINTYVFLDTKKYDKQRK